jgi:ubiquinone/menaquinone biosynthesis C-methylase UbiE
VLEIAPGPARLTVDVAPLLTSPPVIVDASAPMLEQARRRLAGVGGHASMVNGDAFQLPFGGAFDLVYTFRLIRHFDDPDRQRLYRQIGSAMRSGGWLVFDAVNAIVSGPLRAAARPGEYAHYDALVTPETLARELRACGFRIVSLVGVQRRYSALRGVQVLVAPRSRLLARCAMEALDRTGGEPLEWVVVCRRG